MDQPTEISKLKEKIISTPKIIDNELKEFVNKFR
jgi:hypothetical protein